MELQHPIRIRCIRIIGPRPPLPLAHGCLAGYGVSESLDSVTELEPRQTQQVSLDQGHPRTDSKLHLLLRLGSNKMAGRRLIHYVDHSGNFIPLPFFRLCNNICKACRDPGSNRGPSDFQSDALPTELSRQVIQDINVVSFVAHLQGCSRHVRTHARQGSGPCPAQEPPVGIEPTTARLRSACSAN